MIDKLRIDLKSAQRNKDSIRVSVLRLLLSEIKNSEIAKGASLSDDEMIGLIQKELKKRQESIQAFKDAGRVDQAQAEQVEAEILKNFLPDQLSDEELSAIIEAVIAETKASDVKDIGMVIGKVRSQVQNRADGSRIGQIVSQKLR